MVLELPDRRILGRWANAGLSGTSSARPASSRPSRPRTPRLAGTAALTTARTACLTSRVPFVSAPLSSTATPGTAARLTWAAGQVAGGWARWRNRRGGRGTGKDPPQSCRPRGTLLVIERTGRHGSVHLVRPYSRRALAPESVPLSGPEQRGGLEALYASIDRLAEGEPEWPADRESVCKVCR